MNATLFRRTLPLQRGAWLLAGVFVLAGRASAGTGDETGGFFTDTLHSIRVTARTGMWETYVTGYAWHAPWAYDSSTRNRLNETTWGGGFGRSLIDPEGDRHSVFVLGFSDSHHDAQFIAGYNWQRYWNASRNLSLGAGYMAFLFSRKDVASYLPLPAALPCVSVRYRQWELVGLFVPRVTREIKGDVFFFFLRTSL